MNTLLYIFAFIGAWYCLAVATLLALLGAREWRQERRDKAFRVAGECDRVSTYASGPRDAQTPGDRGLHRMDR